MKCNTYAPVLIVLSICLGYLYGQRTTQYGRLDNTYVTNGFMSVSVDSAMKCCTLCGMNVTRRTISFYQASNQCQLNDKHYRITAVQLSTISGWTSFSVLECQENWTSFKDRCYQYFDKNLPWGNSRSFCRGQDGELAVPHSLEHVSLYASMATCNGECSAWIGMSDVARENSFKGVDDIATSPDVLNVIVDNSIMHDCGYLPKGVSDEVYVKKCNAIGTIMCEKDP